MARGAWLREATQTIEIVNAIPSFGKRELLRLKHLDHFGLLEDRNSDETRSGVIPYNPAVMQALQDGGRVG